MTIVRGGTYDLILDLVVQFRQLGTHRRNVTLLEGNWRFLILILICSARLRLTQNAQTYMGDDVTRARDGWGWAGPCRCESG